ncbi:hypothetical protein BDZ97DRAFT_1810220 [Flammula alnicola]|nr:hypothetical protein BDZ97DRAFT_1810220 [Flammula alnicola]
MGAVSDLHDIFEPYIYHLYLTPAHLSTTHQRSNPTSSAQPPPTARSPYTTHILTLLILFFFPLLFIIHLPTFLFAKRVSSSDSRPSS